jgi:hypothetical protein
VKAGMPGATTLDQVLSGLAREGALFERFPGGRVRCYAGNEDGRLSANRS